MVAFKSLHIRSICLLLFTFISSNSYAEKNSCPEGNNIAPYFGTYKVVDVAEFGNLPTEATVKENIGKEMVLSKNLFHIGVVQVSISNPVYKLKCYKQTAEEEGNVPLRTERWSNFYGFGMDRKIIKVLEGYDVKKDVINPLTKIELIDFDEVWYMDGTRRYKMKKTSAIQNKTV
jgi:hypothetical protein